jgi:hypothetical protein
MLATATTSRMSFLRNDTVILRGRIIVRTGCSLPSPSGRGLHGRFGPPAHPPGAPGLPTLARRSFPAEARFAPRPRSPSSPADSRPPDPNVSASPWRPTGRQRRVPAAIRPRTAACNRRRRAEGSAERLAEVVVVMAEVLDGPRPPAAPGARGRRTGCARARLGPCAPQQRGYHARCGDVSQNLTFPG